MLHEAAEIGGLKWFFTPWTPEYSGWWWMLEEPELIVKMEEIPTDTQVLISHGPPLGILDSVEREPGVQAGSPALLDKIQRLPDLKLCVIGHLHHEGGREKTIGNVRFINAAVLNDRNNWRNHPQVFDL